MGVSILEGGKAKRIADALEAIASNMVKTYYTLIVTAQTKDDVAVTGQVVTVREGGADGVIYASAAYEGQPVSFNLPEGFRYHVEITDNLYRHFNPSYADGIIAGMDGAVTLVYGDLHHITTAADIQAALDADADLSGLLGESINVAYKNGTIEWEALEVLEDSVLLVAHDTLPTQMQFDKPQASIWFESGLSAGDYAFKIGNTSYYFTMTRDIPAGGQIRLTNSVFQSFVSENSTEEIENGSTSTTEIVGATMLGTAGTETGLYPMNHNDRVVYGSNNMVESPINTWLNSDTPAGEPIPRVTRFGRAYSVAENGFLADLDPDFVRYVAETEWKCATNTTYECPASMGGLTVKGQRYTYRAKFSLLSEKEVFGTQTGTSVEAGDHVLPVYKDATAADRIKRYGTGTRDWWLRTPGSNAYGERYVYTSGTVNYWYATNTSGVVPACYIRKSV